eukprot:m.271234 g.271234  ORF g.271234 m.271234 type:complete len:1102 (+) comp16089_c0_seq11:51-3356(+)
MRSAILATLCVSAVHGSPMRMADNVEKRSIPAPPVLSGMPDMPDGVNDLTVILVPHSHDDTGWQRNVDQYYEEQVRYIYDSVVECLIRNPARKFIFVETAYFYRWWVEQSAASQQQVYGLFQSGQLEFVNGGWCMADDASPSTDGWIDQVTLGHRYIFDTLNGTIPKYAWHIDPFGLSASYANWFKEMGYSGWVFNRIDTRLKDLWHNETHLEFMWKPEGSPSEPLFAHVLDTHYGAPELTYNGEDYHFDFEVFGGLGGGSDAGSQLPVSQTDPSPFYNHTSEAMAEAFVALTRLRAGWYKLGPPWQKVTAGSGVVLIPFGDDMKFQNADKQYTNMDVLIKTINANSTNGVTVKYGTIGDYMAYINLDAPWPTFGGDFMPLGTNNNVYSTQLAPPKVSEYWTGHYTTRPLMKGLVAKADGAKHTSEIAATLHCAAHPEDTSLCGRQPNADLLLARKVTSVLQHHDNIPGTSSPEAAVNLDVRLWASLDASGRVLKAAAGLSATLNDTVDLLEAGASVDVTLFNPLARGREEFVELPMAGAVEVTVTDGSGAVVPSTVVPALPSWHPSKAVNNSFAMASDTASVVFKVVIPPLTTAVYRVALGNANTAAAPQWSCFDAGEGAADATLSGDKISARFAGATGRLAGITVGGASWGVSQQFAQYHSTTTGNPNSNAYQFAPDRSKFPFGEPLDNNGSILRVCTFKSAVLERAVQSYAVDLGHEGPDCRTEASCKATCGNQGGFNTGCGVYYCCAAKDWQCSGVKACGDLHDCACLTPNVTRPLARMLEETVSLYRGLTTADALDADSIRTTTEFVMLNKDRELVTRYTTDLDTLQPSSYPFDPNHVTHLPVFETDSNGALMLRRVTNRTQWAQSPVDVAEYNVSDSVAGNYYPLASPGAIRVTGTDGRAFAVVTDQAHGATSLQSGWVEVMMGRRCAEQQGIPVDDTDHIVSTNWLVPAANIDGLTAQHRLRAMASSSPLVPLVTAAKGARVDDTVARSNAPTALADNVHLLTLDRVGLETSPADAATRVLLRVRHTFQPNEHSALSKPATVNVATLLPAPFELTNAVELPLNGVGPSTPINDLSAIVLKPMQTRTFEVTVTRH